MPAQALREDIDFQSGGVTCRAWFYRPHGRTAAASPCIVMAHGLGGVRTAGLEPYARRFAAAGLAVLLFDYRHFGASAGTPRQWVSVPRQLQDWAAAIACARGLSGIDPARIALWGTSFSGGHVVMAAARDGRVAAIAAQGAMMDGLAASLNIVRYAGLGQLLRLAAGGLRDAIGALFGAAPRLVPLVAPPGQLATMSTPDAEPGYRAIAGPGWVNGIAARFALGLAFYRPVAQAHRVRCPALLVAVDDSVAPAAAMAKAARRMGPRAELLQWPLGHFDLYVGAGFERGCAAQLAFFQRELAVTARAEPWPQAA